MYPRKSNTSFVVAIAFSLIFVTDAGAVVSSTRLLMIIRREELRRRREYCGVSVRTVTSHNRKHSLARRRTRRRTEGDNVIDTVDFEAPAVQLYKLVSRTVSSRCNVYSLKEKQQLRNLMYMLSHNQIYVDTDVKRGNAAYWKEYGFQKHTRRHASSQGGDALSIPRMNSALYPQTRNLIGSKIRSLPSVAQSSSIICLDGGELTTSTNTFGFNDTTHLNLVRRQLGPREDILLTYLSKVDEWDFDAFYLDEVSDGHSLVTLCMYLFGERCYNFFEHFGFIEKYFENYILQIEAGYGSGERKGVNNVYHNRRHAVDVTQAVHYFITTCGLGASLTDIEMVSLLLGAIVHDFKHPGRSNAFLMNSCNELSLLYNDISVLENYHASEAFRVLRQDECNFLRNMDPATIGSIRHLAIQIILATDLKFHFDVLREFNLHLSDIQNEIREEGKARTYLSAMKMCIKSADICHPTRPMYVHLRWTKCLMEEFFLQGDEEKAMGIEVSPNCNRNDLDIADSQKTFINFLVKPLFKSWVSFLHSPNATICMMTNLDVNEAMWSCSGKNTKGKTFDQLTMVNSERSGMSSLRSIDTVISPPIYSSISNSSSKMETCSSTCHGGHDYVVIDENSDVFDKPNGNNYNTSSEMKDIEIGETK